jgi:hypothetical protein
MAEETKEPEVSIYDLAFELAAAREQIAQKDRVIWAARSSQETEP